MSELQEKQTKVAVNIFTVIISAIMSIIGIVTKGGIML